MFRDLLVREFSPYCALSSDQLDLLEAHYELLARWNERINLTRIRSLEDAVCLHYCESLYVGVLLPPGELQIADVGSGGGFPGIPLAILRPESKVTLIESHQRKSVFLREASRALPNVSVRASRAEVVPHGFDWVVSRAVSPDEVLGLGLASRCLVLVGREDADRLRDRGEVRRLPWGADRFGAVL